MGIADVILAPGCGAFFYDDQAAIRAGAAEDGFCYEGAPLTPGFTSIRMPASSLGIGLVFEGGATVWGDMVAVQYSGAAGRDPLFDVDRIDALVRSVVVPRLLTCDPARFLDACDAVCAPTAMGRLPLAVEYGVSQALLRAAARLSNRTMAEVICSEFGLGLPTRRVPLYAQSGDARHLNVDKMILKRVDVLPHGLINAATKFGSNGGAFMEYVRWVADRIEQIAPQDYRPALHFDIYGLAGLTFGLDVEAISDFIARVGDLVPGYTLHIECPADFGSTPAQVDGYAAILAGLRRRGSAVKVVVDERCNTLDDIRLFAEAKATDIVQIKMPDVGSIADTARAVLVCKENGVGAYVGGSAAETDLSARASVHVAVATQAEMLLAKPGMGVDEGLSIVGNEQSRLLATLTRRVDGPAARAEFAA